MAYDATFYYSITQVGIASKLQFWMRNYWCHLFVPVSKARILKQALWITALYVTFFWFNDYDKERSNIIWNKYMRNNLDNNDHEMLNNAVTLHRGYKTLILFYIRLVASLLASRTKFVNTWYRGVRINFCYYYFPDFSEDNSKIFVKIKNAARNRFFPISGETWSRIQNFFAKNLPLTKTKLTK